MPPVFWQSLRARKHYPWLESSKDHDEQYIAYMMDSGLFVNAIVTEIKFYEVQHVWNYNFGF
jgi:hypothetical protein